MQLIINHGSTGPTRVIQFNRWQLLAVSLVLAVLLLMASGMLYHLVFQKAVRDRWPVVSQMVRWVVRDDIAQQERFMRENLDAMARRVGEMQAQLIKLQMIGERVSGLAGVKAEDLQPVAAAASEAAGGPYRPALRPAATLDTLASALEGLDESTALNADVFTLVESRLLENRLQALMVPSSRPVDGPVGSGFGFRRDPFNSRNALHTGLDFPAPAGAPIRAAAGGVVRSAELHPEYGRLLVLDHGNGLTTRYAHASRILVIPGDIVRREQAVAEVGSTGRSTGPHLHFEVLVDGVPQNPSRFLFAAPGRTPQRPLAAVGRPQGGPRLGQ